MKKLIYVYLNRVLMVFASITYSTMNVFVILDGPERTVM